MAIVGGCLMVAAGLIVLMVGVFVIPHLNPSVFNNINGPGSNVSIQNPQGFVGSILTGVGAFGLVSGIVVLGSGIMLRTKPEQSSVFGVLILTFSVLSFFGSGGFIVGALLGIVGGVMTLRWRKPAVLVQAPASS
jgi:hypothetical protein